jgi:hypothetical protein
VDVVSEDRVPRGFSHRMHRATSRLRADRRLRSAIAVGLVIVLSLVILPAILDDDGAGGQTGYEPGLAFFDAVTAAPSGQLPMGLPGHSFFDDGTFWIRDIDNSVYIALDATTHEVTGRVPAPAGYADAEDGRLYVGDLNAGGMSLKFLGTGWKPVL